MGGVPVSTFKEVGSVPVDPVEATELLASRRKRGEKDRQGAQALVSTRFGRRQAPTATAREAKKRMRQPMKATKESVILL